MFVCEKLILFFGRFKFERTYRASLRSLLQSGAESVVAYAAAHFRFLSASIFELRNRGLTQSFVLSLESPTCGRTITKRARRRLNDKQPSESLRQALFEHNRRFSRRRVWRARSRRCWGFCSSSTSELSLNLKRSVSPNSSISYLLIVLDFVFSEHFEIFSFIIIIIHYR